MPRVARPPPPIFSVVFPATVGNDMDVVRTSEVEAPLASPDAHLCPQCLCCHMQLSSIDYMAATQKYLSVPQ